MFSRQAEQRERLDYGNGRQSSVEMVVQGFCLPALAVLQAGVLFGIAEEKLRLESGLVVKPQVCARYSRQGRGINFDAFDFAIGVVLMHDDNFGLALPSVDVQFGFKSLLSFLAHGARRKVLLGQVSHVYFTTKGFIAATAFFLRAQVRIAHSSVIPQASDQMQAALTYFVNKWITGKVGLAH